MRLIEAYFWSSIFWLLYLPASLTLYLVFGLGDLFGILVIGSLFTFVIFAYGLFEEAVLVEEYQEALILEPEDTPLPTSDDGSFSNVKEFFDLEVQDYEEEKTTTTDADPFPEGVEPEPKLRTDVSIAEFDAPDDDTVS